VVSTDGPKPNTCVLLSNLETDMYVKRKGKGTHSALTPAEQAPTQFTYPGGMEGWVDLGDLLHTEMVYPPEGGHPSKY